MPKHNPQHIEKVYVPKSNPSFTKMVSALEAKTYVTGKYSGREYLFDGAGSIQDVDNRDVDWLLEKRQGKACCGGGDGAQLFYVVEK